jgi:nudix-type nucleoside diphosphatase (YffH/AdpP family)
MENVVINSGIKERKVVYEGYSKMEELTINDGNKEYKREVLSVPNAVAGIIYDTVKNKYIFVQQYRAGAEGIMVEVVAGCIDAGEKPEQSMKREVMEETGYKVDYVKHISDFYSSPGRSTELTSLFYCEVSEKVNEGGGIGDEQISIVEVEKLGLNGRIFFEDPTNPDMQIGVENKMIPPYQLIDAKSIIAVMWMEKSNVLKDMAEVITQAKLRSL